ncbi:MAG: hypothetical protein JXQ73_09795 [Phycisphaerae bacterium]|nr:hypothetical protein [Phycisphaerae bacterium]
MASSRSKSSLTSATSRDIAVEALRGLRQAGPFIQHQLDRLINQRKPARAEAALATELALGVVRHRLTLEHLICLVFRGKLRNLDHGLISVMGVAVYQLIWLDRIPSFAAVDSAVAQAKELAGPKAGGLVNAVLRELLRRRHDDIPVSGADRPTRCVRIDRRRWREFATDVFPEPSRDVPAYLSVSTSHPVGLIREWLGRFGRDKTEEICLSGSLRPPLVLRPNHIRSDSRDLVSRLRAEGVSAEADPTTGAVFVSDSPPVRHLSAVMQGFCQPQDATAQAVVASAPPKPGSKVLDLCAGPGTKTTQLAEYLGNEGLILACDRTPEKTTMIKENCHRMGATCVKAVQSDELPAMAGEVGPFELALADVPCSNSGVLARRPEARYRIDKRHLQSLSRIQSDLLAAAATHVRRGGKLIYSTCSIEQEENEDVVQRFLSTTPGWRLLRSNLTLPTVGQHVTDWRDGGFHAVMLRE